MRGAGGDLTITPKQARRFLLMKQMLFRPRAELSGFAGVDTVFRKLGAIQFDPINPCGNNVDLVLQSRIRGVKKTDYHRWVYEKRQGIEIFQKELCIVPLANVDLARGLHNKKEIARVNAFFKRHQAELKNLLHFIGANGPISARDIDDGRRLISYWGTNTSWGRAALHNLWQFGKLSVVKRDKNRKFYDLPGRAYGVDLKERYPLQMPQIQPKHVLGRIDSVGLLPASGTGAGWLRIGTGKEIKSQLEQLVLSGDVILLDIKNVPRNYVMRSADLPLLKAAQHKKITKRFSFLAPLDNLMWDRDLIKDIFNFNYRWEVYTPIKKRKFGYYVLPVLYGDEFIGRIEPVLLPGKDLLEIRGLWLEPGIVWSPRMQKKFYEYLNHFLSYLDAGNIAWNAPQPEIGKQTRS